MAPILTKDDIGIIKDLVTEIVTKAITENNVILRNEIQQSKSEVMGAINEVQVELKDFKSEMGQFKNEVFGKIKNLRDDIDLFKDEFQHFRIEIFGDIQELRDEISILTGYKDDIEEHEVRIGKLEQNVFPRKN